MGAYFNPDNSIFKKAVRSKIYVDKTGLLKEINQVIGTEDNCIAISHARRFGKSQAAGMIDAYYSRGCDSRELFAKLKISAEQDFDEHMNKYNVIHLDISSFTDSYKDNLIEKLHEYLYGEFRESYPSLDYDKKIDNVLMQIYSISGSPFIIIIDEWDCVIRNLADDRALVHRYMQFLHSIFKSKEAGSFLALGYITGILPVKKIDDESALNNFKEYTMIESDNFTEYFGFTEDEVKTLCEKYEMNFDSVKKWYDGYHISGMDMYNPNSVCEAMTRHRLDSYWKNTSSFETLSRFINMDFDGMKDDVLVMLDGGKSAVNVSKFKNDLSTVNSKDDAITALIHLGYLGYDAERGKAYIPNFEVSLAYESALSEGNWSEISKTISRCNELLWATIDKEEEKVAELLELSHSAYSSVLTYNNENSLACAIRMAYFTAPAYYNVIRELPTGKGFADIAMIPRADSKGKPAMIIELKWDKTAKTAITQIKDRRYGGELKGYGDEILLVGINYDKDDENKKHKCVIESVRV